MKNLLFIFLTILLVACNSPVIETQSKIQEKVELPINNIIKDSEASFDNNDKTSGILDFINGKGWLITKNAATRYNNLINKYGKTLDNPIDPNFGLTQEGENFLLTQEGMIKFALLTQTHKSNIQ
jgi:hypothetical protein